MPDTARGLRARTEVYALDERISDEHLLTLYDVARILGTTYDLARELVNRGSLTSIRISPKNIRVRAGDLRAFLTAGVRGHERRRPSFRSLTS